MKDFWLSCGHHLTDRDAGGALLITDDLLKAYLARPELIPPPEACLAEQTLYAAVLSDPRRRVRDEEIAALLDADARENWSLIIGFRDRLLQQRTLEAAYLDLVRRDVGKTPPLFLNQLVQLILRNALDGCNDPFVLRAAELLFRRQRLTVREGALIAADEETIASTESAPLSPLIAMLESAAESSIDVMVEESAHTYWERSDAFDMALDLTAGRSGLAKLGEVMVSWIKHMLAIDVDIEPLTELHDVRFSWYIGLDAVGTQVGDTLWNAGSLDPRSEASIVGLYRLTFHDRTMLVENIGSEPVYLILAMTPDKMLYMKPQNLLVGLPIRHPEPTS
ncbi:hypothetical protein IVA98_27400 [Bradyrhizobium sp. 160]|uniref:DUF6352 family protein n=1 Tax=Bradyrhizobium sp. 160 TaxID=2782634 RepID=UPI001FFA6180|nr:DUF6352 family protein [Bradyrhizobium sp. 160]MCK1626812.1 hypothetical protein [Bradyrhizobium sp. 160]